MIYDFSINYFEKNNWIYETSVIRFLIKKKPDIIIIFAWHLFKEIKNKWKAKNLPKKTN